MPAHLILQPGGIFSPAPRAADFLAQALAVRIALLQRGLHLAPLRVDREHFIDLRRIIAAASSEPAFHKVGLFANEPDIEHGQEKDRINRINKIFLILQIRSILSKDSPAEKERDFAPTCPHNFLVDELKLLGVALGLACLAGVNLYLTVFVTGLAIHQHWIILSPAYQSLSILGDPLILWISGTLYVLEFFADKIPWVDSVWDTVHTVIRPIGGALLAIRVLGQTSPAFDIVVALVAGGASLVTHSAKASTRLVANTSPEPFSNIALSLAEDGAVVGGLALIHYNPLWALVIFVLLLSIILYFAPRIFRAVKIKLWLIWKKLNGPAESEETPGLPVAMSSRCRCGLRPGKFVGRNRRLGRALHQQAPPRRAGEFFWHANRNERGSGQTYFRRA